MQPGLRYDSGISSDSEISDRPPHDRPAHDRPPHDRPLYDRPLQERRLYDRPAHDRALYNRPPHQRPLYVRSLYDHSPRDRHPHEPQVYYNAQRRSLDRLNLRVKPQFWEPAPQPVYQLRPNLTQPQFRPDLAHPLARHAHPYNAVPDDTCHLRPFLEDHPDHQPFYNRPYLPRMGDSPTERELLVLCVREPSRRSRGGDLIRYSNRLRVPGGEIRQNLYFNRIPDERDVESHGGWVEEENINLEDAHQHLDENQNIEAPQQREHQNEEQCEEEYESDNEDEFEQEIQKNAEPVYQNKNDLASALRREAQKIDEANHEREIEEQCESVFKKRFEIKYLDVKRYFLKKVTRLNEEEDDEPEKQGETDQAEVEPAPTAKRQMYEVELTCSAQDSKDLRIVFIVPGVEKFVPSKPERTRPGWFHYFSCCFGKR